MRNEENEEQKPNGEPLSGMDELLYSVGEALRSRESKAAIASLVQKFADDVPNRTKVLRRAIIWGHLVTVLVLLTVGTLGYVKVISTETTGALLGAVVGGLYYSRRR